MEPAGFEPIDHTADVALRVWADSLEELFRQAALGLSALLTDPARVGRDRAVEIRASGIDEEELLIAWLEEILYAFESRRELLVEFSRPVISPGGEAGSEAGSVAGGEASSEAGSVAGGEAGEPAAYRVRAMARGAIWDRERHRIRSAVKAATYHDLRLAPDAQGRYATTIVFDT